MTTSEKPLQLEVYSPEERLYADSVILVQLPGSDGSFEILKNHAPMIATLKQGTIRIKDVRLEEHSFNVKGGVVEVLNNQVTVLVT